MTQAVHKDRTLSRSLFSSLVALAFVSSCSCSKSTDHKTTAGPKQGPLIFVYDFESGTLEGWDLSWLHLKSSARVVSRPARSGRRALEITLRRTDPMRSKGKRSELAVPYIFQIGKSYWYGFSVFLPGDWKEDFEPEVVVQWFATRDRHLGERPRSPSLALRVKKADWIITNRWDPSPLTVGNTAPKEKLYKGPYRKGVWTDWVFHVRWSFKPDGLVQVYRNGTKVVEKRGPNTYNDVKGPIMKIGVYKSPWNDPKAPSAVSSRLLFFDEIRIGTERAGYRAVAPPPRMLQPKSRRPRPPSH